MRLDTSAAVQLDDRWRTALDHDSIAAFNKVAGDLNLSLGYA